MKNFMSFALLLWSALLLVACEKLLDKDAPSVADDANVVLQLSCYEVSPISTRSIRDISQMCSRVGVAFFKDGTKVKTVRQTVGDEGFGTVAATLEEGTYEVVVIAHNCDGASTITSPEKVTFPNNVVSDTFYYYGTLTATSDRQTFQYQMTRVVAMFRLTLEQPLPAEAKKLWFYYTGGSSTFSPALGYGCVNSRQTVTLNVAAGQQTFEVYTMPHEENDELKIQVRVMGETDNILNELTFENVPVARNHVTTYKGSFMGSSSNAYTFSLTGESDWAGIDVYTF